MKIAIVADGGAGIGAGHQVRSGELAREAQRRGHTVRCWCRDLPGSAHPWAWVDLPCEVLAASSAVPELTAAASADGCDWLVVDHYGWDRTMRSPGAGRVLLCEDLPGRSGPGVDLVIDPHLGSRPDDHACAALCGPDYAVLRKAFRFARHQEGGQRVLLALGANPEPALLARILAALPEEPIDLLLGAAPGALPDRVTVYQGLDAASCATLMTRARAAVVSASGLAYECAAVGLPMVLLHTAGNQDRLVAGWQQAGWGPVLDDSGQGLSMALADLPASVPPRLDVWGAARVIDRLEGRAEVRLRPAAPDDAGILFTWANDAETRRQSFVDRRIAWQEHTGWLARVLADPTRQLWLVCDAEGDVVGQVRGDQETTDEALISLSIAPAERGRRLAVPAITACCRALATRGIRRVRAEIKVGNAASLRAFQQAGFVSVAQGAERLVYHWEAA